MTSMKAERPTRVDHRSQLTLAILASTSINWTMSGSQELKSLKEAMKKLGKKRKVLPDDILCAVAWVPSLCEFSYEHM
jgi:hypothetical protein